jgi:tetratricopeptide (TPR) repeat protein
MSPTREWYEEAARSENEWVRAVILKPGHPMKGEAREIATRARDMAASALGADHPAYAEAEQNLGMYYSTLGDDPAKAEEHFTRARQVAGPYHPVLMLGYYFLGLFHRDAGNPGEARRFLGEALTILRHEGHPDDPRVEQVRALLDEVQAAD